MDVVRAPAAPKASAMETIAMVVTPRRGGENFGHSARWFASVAPRRDVSFARMGNDRVDWRPLFGACDQFLVFRVWDMRAARGANADADIIIFRH